MTRAEMIAKLRDVADRGIASGFWRMRDDVRAIADALEQEMREDTGLYLSPYEVANLRAAIEAIGYPSPYPLPDGYHDHPLAVLNSGDWIGQIYLKLPALPYLPGPNRTAEEYRKLAMKWRSTDDRRELERVRDGINASIRSAENGPRSGRSLNWELASELWADALTKVIGDGK